MKKMLILAPVMALGLLLCAPAANADDWGFWFGDDDLRVRVGVGDRYPVQPTPVFAPRHVCQWEWRQVAVRDAGHYESIWIPGHWDTQIDLRGRVRQVWSAGRYEQRFVPGDTHYVWQRVRICHH